MRQLTHGPRHHFSGRAGVSPWNSSGNRIACMESAFHGRAPQSGERATVGIVDPNTGGFTAVATTGAWGFTSGAAIAWCPQSPNDEILFNDIVDHALVGVRLNVNTGARQVYLRPFEAAGGEGARVASINLGRIARLHAGGGVAGVADPLRDDPAPENDGIFLVSLSTGLHRLAVPLAAIAARACASRPKLRKREFWVENVSFNKPGTRMLFTVLAGGELMRPDVALFTTALDGSGLRMVVPFACGVTRGVWLDEARCVAVHRAGGGGMRPRIFHDAEFTDESTVETAPRNAVSAIPSPDGTMLAIETENSRRRSRALSVVMLRTGAVRHLCDFRVHDDEHFSGAARCEMSPRWNAGGTAICIDAIGGEGTRQLHVVAV